MAVRALPCHVGGGLERHCEDLASGLAASGWSVELLTTPVPADYREKMAARGVALREMPGVPPGRYSLAYLRGTSDFIGRLHAEAPYAVIHGQEFGLGWADPARCAAGARFILSVHGTITSETALHPDLFRRLGPLGKLRALARYGRRWGYAPAWLRSIRRADMVLVDSAFTEGELRRIAPDAAPKVRRVPLGAAMASETPPDRSAARAALGWPPPGEGPPVLFTSGRLEWQKGHDTAIEALALLRDLPWRYVVAGEGGARRAIEARIRRLGLAGRVELSGRLPDRALRDALTGADLFLQPERTHPAFGLATLEALLMNTPVAAARRGAIPELLEACGGWIAEPDDPRALAAVLQTLLEAPEKLAPARRGLREAALERFSLDRMIRGVSAAYEGAPPPES